MSSRREEILAKKARLAELKRQRDERQQQFALAGQGSGTEVSQLDEKAFQEVQSSDLSWTDPTSQQNSRGTPVGNRQPHFELGRQTGPP